MATFNEATRVQIPAMIHLSRIGYQYFGKISEEDKGKIYDPETNILVDVFKQQFERLNPDHKSEAIQTLQAISTDLDNNDLGKTFYQRLTAVSPVKLIDFENPQNNTFHFTAEFTCKNSQDEFRPDITLFINGLPLCFVEVKKPNNHGGMLAESKRMNQQRFPNKKFRRFINITQLMIFSNNMEYDAEGGIVPIQGVFYCTAAKNSAPFNCFREENLSNQPVAPYNRDFTYKDIDPQLEHKILSDFNCQVIRQAPEYQTNLDKNTPTNRVLTSMCSPERLLFILKYGIAYVKMEREVDGKIESTDEKHIMRYQQLFASMAICDQIDKGAKSGVVWHTQGSGKTALSYYLSFILTDYFAKKNVVAKFYFIVDRIDLLEQAKQEFEARGLVVSTASSRDELMAQFRNQQAQQNVSGEAEITVVNIQKFKEDKEEFTLPTYATNLQRIFILDEAHRGYRPGGCFLANLFNADENSIKIALTGTPLLKEDCASSVVFSQYFHTYYYDRSIADGYTLKIIREDIETSYKEKLSEVYDKLDVLVHKNELKKAQIIEHPNYVNELGKYIESDLRKFRKIQGDDTLGGMVICETSEQARVLYAYFNEKFNKPNQKIKVTLPDGTVAEAEMPYYGEKPLRAGLILHDSDDKETRKQIVKDFKKNMSIDILIVFNMLLTGFDAPRLKRLYFGRKLKDHNLLQAITRVNRPYKGNKYGFLIDFADIKKNFDETNEAYLQELNRFNNANEVEGDHTTDTFSQVIEDPKALIAQMKEVRQILFDYTTNNLEDFSSEISTIEDKTVLLDLKKALIAAKDCANVVRTFGDDELKEAFKKVQITNLPEMIREVQHHIDIINQKQAFETSDETKVLINQAMEDIVFKFSKIGNEEMKIVSGEQIQDKWANAIRAFCAVSDPDDPEFITLHEAFLQRFKERGFTIDSMAMFNETTKELDEILKKLTELQRKNISLMKKYNGDAKFARVHKRIREENQRRLSNGEEPLVQLYDEEMVQMLNFIKNDIDQKVFDRNNILKQDAYFERTVMTLLTTELNQHQLATERDDRNQIQHLISQQYLRQYHETYSA